MPDNTDTPIRERVRKEVETNNPPIKPNQFWYIKNEAGEFLRRIRIIAPYPWPVHDPRDETDRWWIIEAYPAKFTRTSIYELSKVPEFNIRYVFKLETGEDGAY